MSAEKSIIISGAGLAGSLLAILLANRGYHVSLYEKRGDMRKTEVAAGRSINLALADRGIVALERAGVMTQVRPLMLPMPGRMLHDEQGELKFQPYSGNPDEINYSVSRAELNKVLLDAAEATGKVDIFFEHSIVDHDFDTHTLSIRDERNNCTVEVAGIPVVGADGAGSPLRRAMVSRLGITSSEDMLDHGYKELNIPPAEDGGFRIAAEALHIWPRGGFMVIALPNLDGSFTVTLFMAHKGDTSFASLDSPSRVEDFFARTFPDLRKLLPTLREDFFANPTGLLGTVRCEPWHYRDQLLLLGDAAHAVVPFHGQGMNCAFEDCRIFDELLLANNDDFAKVAAEFSRIRKPNADAIAAMALENYIVMRDAVRDPKFHLRKALEFELERRFPDKFIPRYSMVMFHAGISYADALARGNRQAQILEILTADAATLDDIDFGKAAELLAAMP